jgi:hypothetical protein
VPATAIAPSSLTAAQVSTTGGVVAWASAEYVVNAATAAGGTAGPLTATASCATANDLILSGGCGIGSAGDVLMLSMPIAGSPGGWQCQSQAGASSSLTAYALCYHHP